MIELEMGKSQMYPHTPKAKLTRGTLRLFTKKKSHVRRHGRKNRLEYTHPAEDGIGPVATCTRYSGDDLNIEAIYPSEQKTTKRQ